MQLEGAVQGTWTYGAATVEPGVVVQSDSPWGGGRGEDFEEVFGPRLLPGAASIGGWDRGGGGGQGWGLEERCCNHMQTRGPKAPCLCKYKDPCLT